MGVAALLEWVVEMSTVSPAEWFASPLGVFCALLIVLVIFLYIRYVSNPWELSISGLSRRICNGGVH